MLTIAFSVVRATNLPFPSIRLKHFKPKAFVEVIAGDLHHHTQSVKWAKKGFLGAMGLQI